MRNKEIQSLLNDVLEEEIPSSQVNLWPAVKANLDAGKDLLHPQGDNMNTARPRLTARFALAISLLLAVLVLFTATPQGRSFAQRVMELFTRAESTSFPHEDSQAAPVVPGEELPTALPPAPLISVAEAEAEVGFDVAELPFVPEGFETLGARLYGKNVSIEYRSQGGYDHIIIMQSQDGFYESNWDSVPAEAIIPVKIGELEGEYTQGTFVVYTGQESATWEPEAAMRRLRWVDNGVWFEMTRHGDGPPAEYLDMESLVKLAESLTR